jgi:pimeloyl-ACP methyl ester carboxylesterase
MGGAIAQTLALRQPSWLDRIVLVGTGARLRVHPLILEGLRPAPAEDLPTSASKANLEAAIDTICRRAYGPSTDEQILRNGRRQLLDIDPTVIYADYNACEILRNGRRQLLDIDPTVIYADYNACDKFDVMDQVRDIKLPTLIIVGSADQMTPPKYGQFLHEQIPNAQLVVITDGGHMVAVEKPTEVAQAVARFLEIL